MNTPIETSERLADELMDNFERFARDWSLATDEQCSEALAYLEPRIAALVAVRADELENYDLAERNQKWLATSKDVLKCANVARHLIIARVGSLRKQLRIALSTAEQQPAFDALKAVLRDELGRDAYDALWARVHQRHPELSRNEKREAA